jgi:hypothetical protein
MNSGVGSKIPYTIKSSVLAAIYFHYPYLVFGVSIFAYCLAFG